MYKVNGKNYVVGASCPCEWTSWWTTSS